MRTFCITCGNDQVGGWYGIHGKCDSYPPPLDGPNNSDGAKDSIHGATPQKRVSLVGTKYLPAGLFGPPSYWKNKKNGTETPECEMSEGPSILEVKPGEGGIIMNSAQIGWVVPYENCGGTGHIVGMGTPPPKLPSDGVSHKNALKTLVACPEIQNLGQDAQETMKSQNLGHGEALICQKFGIGVVSVKNKNFGNRGHSILATEMAGNSAEYVTLREIAGNSFEYPVVLEQLISGAYPGGL